MMTFEIMFERLPNVSHDLRCIGWRSIILRIDPIRSRGALHVSPRSGVSSLRRLRGSRRAGACWSSLEDPGLFQPLGQHGYVVGTGKLALHQRGNREIGL